MPFWDNEKLRLKEDEVDVLFKVYIDICLVSSSFVILSYDTSFIALGYDFLQLRNLRSAAGVLVIRNWSYNLFCIF